MCQRNLPLFVEEPSLPRAGVAWSSHLTPVPSSRFLRAGGNYPGDGESSGGNGAGESSCGNGAGESNAGNGAGDSSGGGNGAGDSSGRRGRMEDGVVRVYGRIGDRRPDS